MTDQEREIVRKAAVALCNLIDCFRGVEYRTHAEFADRNPYTVAEFKDANTQADALKALLSANARARREPRSGDTAKPLVRAVLVC